MMTKEKKKSEKVLQSKQSYDHALVDRLIVLINIHNGYKRNCDILVIYLLNLFGFQRYNGKSFDKSGLYSHKNNFMRKDPTKLMDDQFLDYIADLNNIPLAPSGTDNLEIINSLKNSLYNVKTLITKCKEIEVEGLTYSVLTEMYNRDFKLSDKPDVEEDYIKKSNFLIDELLDSYHTILTNYENKLSKVIQRLESSVSKSYFYEEDNVVYYSSIVEVGSDKGVLYNDAYLSQLESTLGIEIKPLPYKYDLAFVTNYIKSNIGSTGVRLTNKLLDLDTKYVTERGTLMTPEYVNGLKNTLRQTTEKDKFLKDDSVDMLDLDKVSVPEFLQRIDEIQNEDEFVDLKDDFVEPSKIVIADSRTEVYNQIVRGISDMLHNDSEYQMYLELSDDCRKASDLDSQFVQYGMKWSVESPQEFNDLVSKRRDYHRKFTDYGLSTTYEQSFLDQKFNVQISEHKVWQELNVFEDKSFDTIDKDEFLSVCIKVISLFDNKISKKTDKDNNKISIEDILKPRELELYGNCKTYRDTPLISSISSEIEKDFAEDVDIDEKLLLSEIKTSIENIENGNDSGSSFMLDNTCFVKNLYKDVMGNRAYVATSRPALTVLLAEHWLLLCRDFSMALVTELYTKQSGFENEYQTIGSSPQIICGFVVNEAYRRLALKFPNDPDFTKSNNVFTKYQEGGKIGIAIFELRKCFNSVFNKTKNENGLRKLYSDILNYKTKSNPAYRLGNVRYYYELSFNNLKLNRADLKPY